MSAEVVVRPLQERDLDAADRVMRLAFGTFLGAPDPIQVFGDVDYVRGRFNAAPGWAFAAERDGELVGSTFATRWGSFGFLGPLTVRPDLWDQGIARRLMEPVLELFDAWQLRQSGLFTFAQSTKHVGLYQKFGFWPQYLTAVMAKPVAPTRFGGELFSAVPDGGRALGECRALTGAIFDGLDVGHEILAARDQALGDTVLLRDGAGLAGLAVCHCGAGEAGSDACYLKFGAVRPGPGARSRLEGLLDVCQGYASDRGVSRIVAGVNMARHDAYRALLARGYRARAQGVALVRPNEQSYFRPGTFVIDDLR